MPSAPFPKFSDDFVQKLLEEMEERKGKEDSEEEIAQTLQAAHDALLLKHSRKNTPAQIRQKVRAFLR